MHANIKYQLKDLQLPLNNLFRMTQSNLLLLCKVTWLFKKWDYAKKYGVVPFLIGIIVNLKDKMFKSSAIGKINMKYIQ